MTLALNPKILGSLATLSWLMLAHPYMRSLLEFTPSLHMLVQIPLLALVGIGFAPLLGRPAQRVGYYTGMNGTAGTLTAIFCTLFWMIPKSLDAALDSTFYETAKFISVPLLIGLPLRLSWQNTPEVFRSFISAQFIAMLAFLGWLYVSSPIRLCNNYLAWDQEKLGINLLLLAAFLALSLGVRFLFGPLVKISGANSMPEHSYKRRSNYVC